MNLRNKRSVLKFLNNLFCFFIVICIIFISGCQESTDVQKSENNLTVDTITNSESADKTGLSTDEQLAGSENEQGSQVVELEKVEGDNTDTYRNSIDMEFVLIQAGSFKMGSDEWDSELPVHEVTISDAFYIGKYEVTQKQWVEVMGYNPSMLQGDDYPVEYISLANAQEFVAKLNEMEGTDKYRLPSEAEWEYACRAGTTTVYSFGDDESEFDLYGWANDNSDYSSHPVGQKEPNPWGLYDMHGNVWEWCQDKYHDSYEGAPTDGSAWNDDGYSTRVVRGGSFVTGEYKCTSAYRFNAPLGAGPDDSIGFRLLREG